MIVTLERGNRFARVWLREVPDLVYSASRTGEREVEPWLPGIAERRLAAILVQLLMWYPEFPSEKELNFIVGL